MASASNMNNFTTLIKRLEAATSRLEDIATSIDGTSGTNTPAVGGAAVGAISTALVQEAAPPEPLPVSVEAFDKLIENEVAAYVTASRKLGGLVEQQAKSVKSSFEAERTYLYVAAKAKKPDDPPPELMTDIHRHTSAVDELRESNGSSPMINHLHTVSDGIVALGWIVEKRPADYVNNSLGYSQYYGNKVLMQYKDKDKNHTDFVQSYYKLLRALSSYVKEHFATGLTWNNKDGIDALEALKQIQSGTATPKVSTQPTSGGLPPPPPPPLPVLDNSNTSTKETGSGGGDMGSVFNQINQGSSVTSGLRKVDKSEMTHKNPTLRAGSTVPQRTGSQTSLSSNGRGKSPAPNKKPESMRGKKSGRKELDGNKWIVESFENTGSEVIEINAELNHSILVSRCTKCYIKVKGKANAISIDNCTGLSILVDSLVSSIDVIKSPKFQVQVDGYVPTILLDQIDTASIYLGPKSLSTEVFSSKCSSINIVIPPSNEEDDSKELAVPEQIRSVIKDGALVNEIVEHAG